MKKYYCTICDFIYDPEKEGDDFEDLSSEEWSCPFCDASKDQFAVIHHLGEDETGGEAQEKHVPVIKETEEGINVMVGSVPHPMFTEHHIEWVELRDGEKIIDKVHLDPADEPLGFFEEVDFSPSLKAYAACNLHGIWESEDL